MQSWSGLHNVVETHLMVLKKLFFSKRPVIGPFQCCKILQSGQIYQRLTRKPMGNAGFSHSQTDDEKSEGLTFDYQTG